MRGTIVLPLSKSPFPRGRVGPETWQDWYRGAVRANKFAISTPNSEVLILSNMTYDGVSEVGKYIWAFNQIDIKTPLRVIRECTETIGQINFLFKYAKSEGKDIIIVSTFLHYLRVQWLIWQNPLSRKVRYKHYAAWGIPRPREAVTDIILIFLFPLLDIFGLRDRFLRAVHQHRALGKL